MKNVFVNGVRVVFKVFKDAVKIGSYVVTVDNGFDAASETLHPIEVILDSFSQKDMQKLSFAAVIQPTDIKAIVPGEYLPDLVEAGNLLRIEERDLTIVDFSTDPMKAAYVFLVRDSSVAIAL